MRNNLYELLDVKPDATADQIRKAYRQLAVDCHPDKPGGSMEKMLLLNEAKETLIDPKKRSIYDHKLYFSEKRMVTEAKIEIRGHLSSGNILPFSAKYKLKHQKHISQFGVSPLTYRGNSYKIAYNSKHYELKSNGEIIHVNDIYSFINERSKDEKNYSNTGNNLSLTTPLSIITAIDLFINFLKGAYISESLNSLIGYLHKEISRLRLNNTDSKDLLLFQAFYEIILFSKKTMDEKKDLIFSISKVYDYTKSISEAEKEVILPLFSNHDFRNLFLYALNLYWNSTTDLIETEKSKRLNGAAETVNFLESLLNRLSNCEDHEPVLRASKFIKLLAILENQLTNSHTKLCTANDYREFAFHLLDWIPAIKENAEVKIIINLFIKIGIYFQIASELELKNEVRMADAMLAKEIFFTCLLLSENTRPDIFLYSRIHAIKQLRSIEFYEPNLDNLLTELINQTIRLSDFFPFFENRQSNISVFKSTESPLPLMKKLLHSLVQSAQENKMKPLKKMDHSRSTIFYQAYSACLQNWYEEKTAPNLEKNFRLWLMDELLAEKNWTFFNIEQNLLSPCIMVDRTPDGWLKSRRSYPFPEGPEFAVFRSFNGFEINHKTGEIILFLEKWHEGLPDYEKAFSSDDLFQMIERNITCASFSLDPVDAEKPYHPFNQMNFEPKNLAHSEFLNTMLLTDYILKFLTTKQEVQGEFPFERRPIDQAIEHLPPHLKKIINDFKPLGNRSIHRFWIEADRLEIIVNEDKQQQTVQEHFSNVTMVVKKHRMMRDSNGELKDVGNEEEGWPIYILTSNQLTDLISKRIALDDQSAMIFIVHSLPKQIELVYWENSEILYRFNPTDDCDLIARLMLEKNELNGKISITSKNSLLLYDLILTMCEQANLAHRFSPEYILAQELTKNYEELSCFPEFYRLKEFCKITMFVQKLNNIQYTAKHAIEAINFLTHAPAEEEPKNKIFESYKLNYNQSIESFTSQIHQWQKNLSTKALTDESTKSLTQLGTTIKTSSAERSVYYHALIKQFSFLVNGKSQVNAFLDGNHRPLLQAMVKHQQELAVKQISQHFPNCTTQLIIDALDDSKEAIHKLAKNKACFDFSEIKTSQDKLLQECVHFGLGKDEKFESKENSCPWVPATIRQEWIKDKSHNNIYSFFSYGGVRVALQDRTTHLYQMRDEHGKHLKFGITSLENRYSKAQLVSYGNASIHIVATGSRQEMKRLEQEVHKTLPIGPLERQQCYIEIQRRKGYKVPPY